MTVREIIIQQIDLQEIYLDPVEAVKNFLNKVGMKAGGKRKG